MYIHVIDFNYLGVIVYLIVKLKINSNSKTLYLLVEM